MRRSVVLTLLLAACSQVAPPPEPSRPAFSLSAASASTLRVIALPENGQGASFGSGVAVAPNMVLTNRHVVAEIADSANPAVFVLDNSARFPRQIAAVIGADPRLDLALLYVRDSTSTPVTFALANPRQLDQVTALGFPAATDEIFGRMRESVSATAGQVTAVDEGPVGSYGPIDLILHTATVNPGNSGGPLFNACGELVGINTLRANPRETSNAFVASAASEVISFLESYGVHPSIASHVCAAAQPSNSAACAYDRTALDRAIAAKDLETLDPLLGVIPETCAAILNEAWTARRTIARDVVNTFAAMGGTWRLPDQECAQRTALVLSGSAVWGAAGDQRQIERLTSSTGGAVTTLTVFPEGTNPIHYRYSLNGDKLRIENLSSHASWEMERCTG